MFQFLKKKPEKKQAVSESEKPTKSVKTQKEQEHIATRKGEIGEYKVNIQLDQMPKEYKHLEDLMVTNSKSTSGYSQIDHVLLTPYGIFVIETKNYQGTIYGGKNRKNWSVNGKFTMMNPFMQNYGHIKVLKELVDNSYQNYFVSIISFTKRCTFKVEEELRKITSNDLIVYDIELSEFIHRKVSVNKLQNNHQPILSDTAIDKIYQTLLKVNITDPVLREKHTKEIIKSKDENANMKNTINQCVICNQKVSDKVAAYCKNNKRFNGKIYCYDHQKTVK
jgi:Nuclease-related domain